MSKQIQAKTFEASGVMVHAKQNHKKTKNVNEPHTLITIAIPLMENRKFEEICFNDGARICYKIEYIPNKHFEIKNEGSQSSKSVVEKT